MCLFFFNDTATTEIYTLSLHDALPIYLFGSRAGCLYSSSVAGNETIRYSLRERLVERGTDLAHRSGSEDRKSTRLNSSHANISYAVFCLKKKKQIRKTQLL